MSPETTASSERTAPERSCLAVYYSADWVPTLSGMDRLQAAVPGMHDEDLHDLLHAADALVGAIETEQRKRCQTEGLPHDRDD